MPLSNSPLVYMEESLSEQHRSNTHSTKSKFGLIVLSLWILSMDEFDYLDNLEKIQIDL